MCRIAVLQFPWARQSVGPPLPMESSTLPSQALSAMRSVASACKSLPTPPWHFLCPRLVSFSYPDLRPGPHPSELPSVLLTPAACRMGCGMCPYCWQAAVSAAGLRAAPPVSANRGEPAPPPNQPFRTSRPQLGMLQLCASDAPTDTSSAPEAQAACSSSSPGQTRGQTRRSDPSSLCTTYLPDHSSCVRCPQPQTAPQSFSLSRDALAACSSSSPGRRRRTGPTPQPTAQPPSAPSWTATIMPSCVKLPDPSDDPQRWDWYATSAEQAPWLTDVGHTQRSLQGHEP